MNPLMAISNLITLLNNVDHIPGHTLYTDLFYQVAQALPDNATIAEVGVWMGKSTILLQNLIALQNKQVIHHVIDTFKGSPNEEYHQKIIQITGGTIRHVFEENLQKHGLIQNAIRIHEGLSVEVAKEFPDNHFEFVFIDADHSTEAVIQDITAWLPKVKPQGYLAGDDYNWPSVRAGVLRCLPLQSVQITPNGQCWIYRKV